MMLVRDLGRIAAVALMTALLSAPLFHVGAAGADDEEAAAAAEPAALLEVEGVRLDLETEENADESAEAAPIAVLRVSNSHGEPRSIRATVRMQVVRPTPPMARMIAMPTEVWTKEVTLDLEPRASTTLRLPTETAVPEGHRVQWILQVGDETRLVGALPSLELSLPTQETEGEPVAPPAGDA